MALIVYNKENSRPQQVVYQGNDQVYNENPLQAGEF